MAVIRLTSGSGLVDLSGGDYVIGTPESDFVIGSPGDDTIEGLGGDDIINGNGANDSLLGGDGNDNLQGNIGNEIIFGNSGNDNLYGEIGDDSLFGGQDNDNLWGDDGNDYVVGDEGDDQLRGNLGNDILLGKNGNDTLFGGQDNDLLYGNKGNDQLYDDTGDDTLLGGEGNDTAEGGENSDYLSGDKGNDFLAGGVGSDTLDGGEGNDSLLGDPQDGPPAFDPGTGQPVPPLEQRLRNAVAQDVIIAGVGDDTALGCTGNDQIFGNEGGDLLFGNTGTDNISGGSDNDSIYGGADTDQLFGDRGDDALVGNTGNDIASGGVGNDMVYGNTGNDSLMGDEGNDSIYGGQGNDTVEGGAGFDLLTGNSGADVFSINVNQGTTQLAEVDVVLDFETDKDFVYLQPGLTYETLNIFQGSAENAGDTVIQDTITGQFLLVLKNTTRTTITRTNFLPELPEVPVSVAPQPQPSIVSFSTATYTVSEPTAAGTTTTVTVTVSRTGNSIAPASVTVTATPNTAQQGIDYVETSQLVGWNAGETGEKQVTFTINSDNNNAITTPKTFNLLLANPTNTTLGVNPTATVSIQPFSPGTIEFGATQYTITEDGSGVQTIVVKRTGGSQGEITADITLTPSADPNSAASVNTTASVPVIFADGDTADKTVTITSLLNLNAVPSGVVSTTLNITNIQGGATAGATATLNIQDIGTPTIKVEATDPRADENPNLAAADQLGQFTFTRTAPDISQALTISYTIDTAPPATPTENAKAVPQTDYQPLTGTVTFAAGAATATVDVTPIRNTAATGNRDVKVSVAQGGGYNVDPTTNTATVEVVDADSQIVEITASVPAGKEVITGQPAQSGQFKVSRKDLAGNPATIGSLTVSYTVSGSATSDADYGAIPVTVTFENGQFEKVIDVNVIDDTVAEPTKTVRVSLNPGTGANTYSINPNFKNASVSILDNEKPTLLLYPSKSPAFQTSPTDPTTPPVPGEFLLQRFGDLVPSLTVPYTFGSNTTARPGVDFSFPDYVAGTPGGVITVGSGQGEVRLPITPIIDAARPARPDVDVIVMGLTDPGATAPYSLGTPSTGQQMIIINNALI
ncbi:hypothetical protein NG798_04340 [Ancylothrix sp. C2]|uniref:Calx-beta domain-containing protein n=1 Tax=Ancylothrix sp. D3o TaxID=2953691 RepID=UPI0021BA67EC|nr:Calx-beta domain-containing protein [Ancylothrix sp. D3o]MCT7949008.1 hypothetical protein [Ancylothrix sp. D3o]